MLETPSTSPRYIRLRRLNSMEAYKRVGAGGGGDCPRRAERATKYA